MEYKSIYGTVILKFMLNRRFVRFELFYVVVELSAFVGVPQHLGVAQTPRKNLLGYIFLVALCILKIH